MRRNRFILLAPIVAIGMSSTQASAFCQTTTCKSCPTGDELCPTGAKVSWRRPCVSYSLQVNASRRITLETATAAADQAFGAWQEAICPGTGAHPSILASNAYGPVACERIEYVPWQGNANEIIFRDDAWPHEDKRDAIALTTVTFNVITGEIYDVDMEINGLMPLSTEMPVPFESYDLQSIITHESGHFFGLAHAQPFHVESTMAPSYVMGSDAYRTLDADDIEGICAIYPNDREMSACDFSPKPRFGPECGMEPVRGGLCAAVPGAHRDLDEGFVFGALIFFRSWRARRARS